MTKQEIIKQLKTAERKEQMTCKACVYCKKASGYSSTYQKGYMCYECTNPSSDYYSAYINIDPYGQRGNFWPGCSEYKDKGR